MYTYLGIDNTQKERLVLVCKGFNETGEIKQLWRQKLRSEGAISRFFTHLAEYHSPITMATSGVVRDPAGVLAQHVQRGGMRDAASIPRLGAWPTTPQFTAHFPACGSSRTAGHSRRAISLDDTHSHDQLESLQASIGNLFHEASLIAQRLSYLQGNQLGFGVR